MMTLFRTKSDITNLENFENFDSVSEAHDIWISEESSSITYECHLYAAEIAREMTKIEEQKRSSCGFDWGLVADMTRKHQRFEHMKYHAFENDGVTFTIKPTLYLVGCQNQALVLYNRLKNKLGEPSIVLMNPLFMTNLLHQEEIDKRNIKEFNKSRTTRISSSDFNPKVTESDETIKNIAPVFPSTGEKTSNQEFVATTSEVDRLGSETDKPNETIMEETDSEIIPTVKYSGLDFFANMGDSYLPGEISDTLGSNAKDMYSKSNFLVNFGSVQPEVLYTLETLKSRLEKKAKAAL